MRDLRGCVDLHLHSAPDLRPRRYDDLALAAAARAAGYRAILLKSHHTLTADRAQIAARAVPGIGVFGGLALNRAVGGINPDAVEFALALGAKQIWFPTVSAVVEAAHRLEGARPPVHVRGADGGLLPEVIQVLGLIKDAGAVLGTGHLDRDEIRLVVGEALRMGIGKIVVTHPEHPLIDLPLGEQRELASKGVLFERCFCFTVGAVSGRAPTVAHIAGAIREVGAASTVLATDLGRADLPDPIESMAMYQQGLVQAGVSEEDVRLMSCETPARLLGL